MYEILWQNPDGNGNVLVRARITVNGQVIDDTFTVAIPPTVESLVTPLIQQRVADLSSSSAPAPSVLDQIINAGAQQ